MNPTLVTLSEITFVIVAIVYLMLLLHSFKTGLTRVRWDKAKKKRFHRTIVISVVSWIAFASFWSISGIMSSFDLFPLNLMPIIMVPLMVIVVWVVRSQDLREIVNHVSPSTVLYLQSFRLFVEIALWMMFVGNVIPVQMTFEGRNFDILVGLTGPVMAFLVSRNRVSRTVLITWNLIGLALLINIVTIAILSTPTPLRVFMNEPSNTIVAKFPSVFLPAVLVPLAYSLHFLSLKQAWSWKNVKKYRVDHG